MNARRIHRQHDVDAVIDDERDMIAVRHFLQPARPFVEQTRIPFLFTKLHERHAAPDRLFDDSFKSFFGHTPVSHEVEREIKGCHTCPPLP